MSVFFACTTGSLDCETKDPSSVLLLELWSCLGLDLIYCLWFPFPDISFLPSYFSVSLLSSFRESVRERERERKCRKVKVPSSADYNYGYDALFNVIT